MDELEQDQDQPAWEHGRVARAPAREGEYALHRLDKIRHAVLAEIVDKLSE